MPLLSSLLRSFLGKSFNERPSLSISASMEISNPFTTLDGEEHSLLIYHNTWSPYNFKYLAKTIVLKLIGSNASGESTSFDKLVDKLNYTFYHARTI